MWDKPNGSVLNEKIWDDIADLEELSSFPIEAMHRPAEKVYIYSTGFEMACFLLITFVV